MITRILKFEKEEVTKINNLFKNSSISDYTNKGEGENIILKEYEIKENDTDIKVIFRVYVKDERVISSLEISENGSSDFEEISYIEEKSYDMKVNGNSIRIKFEIE
ncbi:hypothetical protein HMPREF1092_01087 [Clostridium thermobutyricum]|uniref:Uncharacterized protein n=1 Tax=Clostridium thermobutyricum TaxID=29372 RepID=N9XQ55_9CLOT|nr:hypothetical protein [Clostridium thermobutyricum]ENZ01853.1 hypothetical protein HMPREF1092_01087 [Clostridium thermobutyricum]